MDEVSDVPSGLRSETVTEPIVLLVNAIEICWAAVPLNVGLAFCPGTVVVCDSADPSTVIVPVSSAGTS